jgi:hypothetical protein
MRTHESPDKPASIEPRIAVVAIHGVGDHLPFATAREIGNLLAELEYDPSGTPRYAPFTEIFKRVNVRPVKTLDQSKEEPWRAGEHKGVKWGPLDAIARAAYDPATRSATLSAVDQIGLDHLFMYGQLAHYKGEKPEDTYELLRLEGRRVAPQAGSNSNRQSIAPDAAGEMAKELREHGIKTPQARAGEGSGKAPVAAFPGTNEKVVHIYEMYWADLSRLGTAFAQVFAELYQLLFHLGSVGANNVKAAAIHQDPPALSAWKMFDRAQTIAAATLAWPIPIFNLFLAALVPAVVVVSLMRRRLSAAEEFFALEAIIGILLAIGCGCVLLKRGFFSMLAYVAPLLSITAGGVLLAIFTYNAGYIPDREDTEAWCAIIISALAYGGVTLIVKADSKRRPGSGRAALWMASAFVLRRTSRRLVDVSVWTPLLRDLGVFELH